MIAARKETALQQEAAFHLPVEIVPVAGKDPWTLFPVSFQMRPIDGRIEGPVRIRLGEIARVLRKALEAVIAEAIGVGRQVPRVTGSGN